MKLTFRISVQEMTLHNGSPIAVVGVPDARYPGNDKCNDKLHIPGDCLMLGEEIEVIITDEYNTLKSTNE